MKFLLIFMLGSILAGVAIVVLQTAVIELGGISNEAVAQLEEDYALLYFVLFFVLATGFSYLLSRSIILRIECMSAAVMEMKEGNLSIRIPIDSNDELGRLANDLNQMASHLQESLEREQQAEAMKNSIITNISHDLRTPLTSMMGYIELVQVHLRQDIEASERYIGISLRKGHELKQQIDELLEYCHLTFTGVKLNLETVAVKPLVQQVMIDFVPQLEAAELGFELKDESGRETYIQADISLIVRLLKNVINNGIFYGKKGGKLMIWIENIEDNVKISIINYGEPIAKEDMPYIFERLYRGDKSRNAHSGGKGMGLAITKSIAELHQGKITVHSDENETVFACLFPEYRPKIQEAVEK